MNQRRFIWIGLLLCGLLCGIAHADTFQLTDGASVSGDIISYNETGLRLRLADGNYSDPVPWTKFSQDDLKRLAKDPKMEPFVTPNIEVTEEQRIKRTEVPVNQPPRLKHPAGGSLFGAMLSSTVGLFVIVLLWGAGIYAAYEVALYRRRPKGIVCGLAAIPGLGFLSPIIFLWLPSQRLSNEEEETYQAETTVVEAPSFVVPGMPPATPPAPSRPPAPRRPANSTEETDESTEEIDTGGLHLSQPTPAAAAALPQTQIFQRGAFMFNRRFFETKFSGFFSVARREADKDMVLVIKSARGEFHAERVSRISSNELYAQVRKGPATEEVMIPFTEIQEVRLKHKDSPN